MSDSPHEIPNHWNWNTIGEIGEVHSGSTPSTEEQDNFGGDIPWVTPADLSNYDGKYIGGGRRSLTEKGLNSCSAVILPERSILFSSRAPIGYTVIAANPIATNQGFKNLIPGDCVTSDYVYHYLKGNKALAESYASGTTFKELSATRFSRIPIPVPPLPEQQRIVEKIEELFSDLDAGIADLKKARKQLQRYRQSVLQAAVEGRLTKAWREEHDPEPAEKLLERILKKRRVQKYDFVLTNPPFGKKSSFTVINEKGEAENKTLTYERDDFWATSSNKQLNFLQHVANMLTIGGTAAIVVPDNVLFEGGGAGETVRKRLLRQYDVHTLLRLPTGIFYAQGVKANVLFFDRKPASETPWTRQLWIYDLRTNKHFTLKRNPLTYDDLQDFLSSYRSGKRSTREETERFKAFEYEDLISRDKTNLDLFWLRDESLENTKNLPEPDMLAAEIVENLGSALEQFNSIHEELQA